ncbi:hypothetical protein CRUP_003434 [Coryphaenoides rupestris]|nr:hypothetical protein CRUP_003434 [Coryphaenoides rupestris]
MKAVVVIFFIVVIQCNDGRLYVQGPTEPVLEGDGVDLECMSTDPDVDVSQVELRRTPHGSKWPGWCSAGYRRLQSVSNRLTISRMNMYWSGDYTCVSNNATATDNSSETMTLKIRYLWEPRLRWHERFGRFMGSMMEPSSLKVQQGDDVVVDCSSPSSETPEYYWSKGGLEDWIVKSSTLTLTSVKAADGGKYMCTAMHPTYPALKMSRTIDINVLHEDASWYQTTNGRVVLIGAGMAAALLVLILTMGTLLFRRVQRAKLAQRAINDHLQKKPIFKGSAESVPASISGDTQPLV